MQGPVQSFRSAFWPIFAFVMAFGLLIGFGGILLLHGLRVDPLGMVVGIAAAELTGAALTVLAVLYFKVYVGPEGVRGYNFWGVYRTVRWDDVGSVRPLNLAGLRFLRLRARSGGAPLWLPLFLAEPREFEEAVQRHAGPEHPLARALDEAG